jgi:organic hydroperoxide reductase OsmC/OhrA
MSEYQAHIRWQRAHTEAFIDSRYSRAHTWEFDGGIVVPGSSSVHSVPLPYSKPENVDPEEAFVAAISSCHMLVFLYLAAKAKFVIDSYDDLAIGRMTKNAKGRLAITHTRLEPHIALSGANVPTDAVIRQLHHDAHEECYIANSVLTEITVGGSWRHAP